VRHLLLFDVVQRALITREESEGCFRGGECDMSDLQQESETECVDLTGGSKTERMDEGLTVVEKHSCPRGGSCMETAGVT
jgi:hypothetical protein